MANPDPALAPVTGSALQAGDVAVLTLTRSSTGRIQFEVRTHAFGMVKIEIGSDEYTRLLFGESGVPALVARHVLARKPVTQPNAGTER